MIELYEFPLSGNCHKVRLLLSMLKLSYRSVPLNGAQAEHKSAELLAMNPFGQLPVLRDGDTVIRDSQAILIYLAARYGDSRWLPAESADLARVTAWLFTAANEVARGPNALRLHYKLGRTVDLNDAQRTSESLLRIMEAHLAGRDWLATEHPSIADLAVYPYLALAHEGKLDLSGFHAITGWLRRVQQLPGYISMPGMLAL